MLGRHVRAWGQVWQEWQCGLGVRSGGLWKMEFQVEVCVKWPKYK